jgi:hypothetical protein
MTRKLLTWIVVLSTLGMLSLSAIAEDAQSPKPEVQSLAAGRENGARPKTWKALAKAVSKNNFRTVNSGDSLAA